MITLTVKSFTVIIFLLIVICKRIIATYGFYYKIDIGIEPRIRYVRIRRAVT